MTSPRWRPPTREERQLGLLWGAAAISALVLRPLWIAIAPHLRSCALRSITGVPCPTCGTTRTALALLDAEPAAALAVNPLAAVVGGIFIAGGVLALAWATLRWPVPSLGWRWSRTWTMTFIGVILVNWIYLILTH